MANAPCRIEHGALLALPGGARTVHIDVAIAAVAIRAALLTERFDHEGRLAGDVPIGMHDLVDVKGHGVLLARRHVDLDHHGIPGHEARGEAAPVLHVPVVESADVVDAVCAPDEQARSLG